MNAPEWPPSRPAQPSRADLAKLFDRCLALKADIQPGMAQVIADALAVNPASSALRESACTCAMGRWSGDADRRGDVLQEAVGVVLTSLHRRKLVFRGKDIDHFAKWLWIVWYRACRHAWNQKGARGVRGLVPSNAAPIAHIAAATDISELRRRLLEWIERLHDPELEAVLVDWIDGATVRETAFEHHLSKSEVARMRKEGAARLFTTAREEGWA
jgi:DNA-directed RNA polymerase specialized sigma24 family protein